MPVMYYVSHNDVKLGPFTMQEVRRKLENQEIGPADLVFVEGKNQWTKLGEHPDFQRPPEAPPKMPPPMTAKPAKPPTTPSPAPMAAPPMTAPPPQAVQRPPPPKAAPPMSETSHGPSPTIQMVGGVGTIELTDLTTSGHFSLQILSDKIHDVYAAKVVVEAGEATELRFEAPSTATVGDDVSFKAVAHDSFGNVTRKFDGSVDLSYSGTAKGPSSITLKQGEVEFHMSHTVAEVIKIDVNSRNLTAKPMSVEFRAGPAVRLVVESPANAVAGERITVQVRAVDKFGNLSSDFASDVKLKIDSSAA